jgi:murein hydrolase activator
MMKGFRSFQFVVVLVLCVSAGNSFTYGGDEGAKTKELERIDREMHEKKKEIKRATQKERSILSELDKIDRDIQSGTFALVDQQKQLRLAEANLREIEQNNLEISLKIEGLKQVYGQRIRALYKMSRTGNSGLFLSDNLGDSFKRIKYLTVIAERDHTIIREYSSSLDRLTVRQTEIAEKKGDILSRKQAIEIKTVELEARKRKKAELLASVRKEKNLYEQSLRELEESSASLWSLINKVEREKKAANTALSRAPAGSGSLQAGGPKLPWPVDGQVLTRFGIQRHPQFGTMVFRRGIDIGARAGEAVRAVSDGEAVYADWYKGYGKLIILDHGSGFYTLYGNLSHVDVKKGERVAQSQVIGQAGDTGSTKGSKLYFELRRNGEAQDPLSWLARK